MMIIKFILNHAYIFGLFIIKFMEFTTYINDTYTNLNTRTLLHDSNGMTKIEKEKIYKILDFLASQPKLLYNCEDKYIFIPELRKKMISLIKSKNNYDDIKNSIKDCKTDECFMAHVLLCFHAIPKALLMISTSIHTRVRPMLEEGKTGWFDNFSLNAYLYQLTTVVYSEYDDNSDDSMFSINKPKLLIKNEKKISNPKSLLYNLGNLYRCFFEFNISHEDEIMRLSNEEALNYLDKLVEKYPYFTYQCHGCDCFELSSKTCTIQDISEFSKRYPNTLIGGILNTETYSSGKGQHWMAVLFLNSQVYLICSQGGDFNSFHDKNRLNSQLNKFGFGKQYNSTIIQNDSSNCGLYSVLSNLMALIQLNNLNKLEKDIFLNIAEIVDNIGNDAKKLNKKGIYKLKERLIGWTM